MGSCTSSVHPISFENKVKAIRILNSVYTDEDDDRKSTNVRKIEEFNEKNMNIIQETKIHVFKEKLTIIEHLDLVIFKNNDKKILLDRKIHDIIDKNGNEALELVEAAKKNEACVFVVR